ncbi:MAG TPA: tripartite tricarboxylate transporter permease, partial [Anaerolineales bacterium]|nr:tripartite tricarboxylate transporter permease [Anaerolineales bacterium]
MLTAVLPYLSLLGLAVLGLLVSVIFSLIPALHIYNVAGFALIIYAANPELFDGQQLAMFMLGMVVGYAMLNTLPAIFLSAPDDSMAFAVLPAQQFLLNGRGFEAVVLVGLGSLGGVFVLLLISPFIAPLLSPMRVLMGPHLHWILGVICVYMILSEWPFSTGEGSEMVRFRKAWSQLLAGALTFLLSGIIGFIVFNRSFVPLEKSYQNLLPAFTGFFAVPALLHTILFGKRPPKQTVSDHLNLTYDLLWRGVVSGAMGGLFAAFVPVVTAGIGGLMAGHATAQRDERIF